MLTKLIPSAICLFIFSLNSFPQSYQITITNGVLVDNYDYEFDVVIKSLSGNLELTSYQAALNHHFINKGELKFSYINGTSELNNIPLVAIGIFGNSNDSILTFASLPGIDSAKEIDIIGENETIVGRFLLSSTISLAEEDLFISWNFASNAVTILTGSGFTDITNPANHFPEAETNNYNLNKSGTEDPGSSEEAVVIDKFELMQNYPNPFNPTTIIKYKVPSESFVQVKIFNVLSEEVKSLVGKFFSPGIYEVKFEAESLSNGYYIYCLYANNNIIDKKKMILLK